MEFLAAPQTLNPLKLAVLSSERGEIIDGYLTGNDEKEIFPIIDGIPCMIPGSFGERRDSLVERYGSRHVPDAPETGFPYLSKKEVKTRNGFDLQISRTGAATHFLKRTPEVFCSAIGVSLEEAAAWLSGKLMLDAGAGGGQYTFDALNLGAEVIALDINRIGLSFLYNQVKDHPRAHVMEGSVLQLPIRTECINLAFSVGVLHHTANLLLGFHEIARCTRVGGNLVLGVYGKYRFWRYYTLLRILTTRIPLRLLWYLCYPLAVISYVPGLHQVCHPWVERKEPLRSRVTGAFDHFHPPYQGYYSREEISGLFEDLECFSSMVFTPFGACKATKSKALEKAFPRKDYNF